MIRNQIEAVVNQLVSKPKFLYGTINELNLFADDTSFATGVVMLYTLKPIDVSTTLSNSVNSKYSLYLEFLYKTEFDNYSFQNEEIVLQAEQLCNEFLVKLEYYRESPNESRYFKIHRGENAKCLPVYNKSSLDVNSTGVSLIITLNTMNNQAYDPTTRPV